MKQLKKTILTLALLITAVTGARADQLASSYSSNATLNAVTVSDNMEVTIASGVTVTINNGLNITSGTLTVTGPGTLVVTGAKGNDGNSDFDGGPGGTGGVAISGNIIVQGGATVTATGGTGGTGGNGEWDGGTGGNGGVAFAGTLTYKSGTVTANGGSAGSGGWSDDEERYASSGSAGKAFANDVDFTQTTGYSVTNGTSTIGSVLNQRKVVISGGTPIPTDEPSSGPEVAWNKAEKTGTFKMPGGNVELEPEYYPLATVADGGVTAADADARATTDDPLVKVDATKLTGAKKLMYFVSNSGTTAPAYDAEGWTDQLPTAEGLTQQGIVYVWYYPVGIDEGVDGATATYSDGDICLQSITARIAAAPTYDVTFAEGTDPNEWSADPNTGVTKGQTVTVTYTGTKKVIGVKAEKKAAKPAAEGHALSASVVGEIVGSDGNVYAVADKDNLPEGVTAVAMVAYKSATAGSSLAIALADEGSMNWNSAKSTCASKAAIGGKSWKLPTKDEWEQMFSANGGSTGLKTALSAAGGASSTLQNGYCWSSTEVVLDPEDDPDMAWIYSFGEGRWYWDDMGNGRQVRACLAF